MAFSEGQRSSQLGAGFAGLPMNSRGYRFGLPVMDERLHVAGELQHELTGSVTRRIVRNPGVRKNREGHT